MSRARQSENALRYDAHAHHAAPPVTVEEAARWQLPIQPSDDDQAADRARDRRDRRLFIAFGLIVAVVIAAQAVRWAV